MAKLKKAWYITYMPFNFLFFFRIVGGFILVTLGLGLYFIGSSPGIPSILLGELSSPSSISAASADPCRLDGIQVEQTAFISQTEDSRTLGYPDSRKIVRSVSGKLYIAYRKKDPKNGNRYQIFISSSSDNGMTWILENGGKAISAGVGKYDQRVPSLLVIDETVHVVWYGSDRTLKAKNRREVKYSMSKDRGKTFTPWRNIGVIERYGGQDQWQEHPVLGARDNQHLYIVWEGKDKANRKPQIKFSQSTDGGDHWTKPINVSPTSNNAQSRPVLITRQGELYIFAYATYDSQRGNSVIVVTRSNDNGQTWQKWATLSQIDRDSRHVSAIVTGDGALHLAYRQTDGQHSWIMYQFSRDGSMWSSEERLASSSLGQFFPSLSISNSEIYLAWTEASAQAAKLPKEEITAPAYGFVAKRVNNTFVKLWHEPIDGFWLTLPYQSLTPEFLFLRTQSNKHHVCYAALNP